MSANGYARSVRIDDESGNSLVSCCRVGLEETYENACYCAVGNKGLGSV